MAFATAASRLAAAVVRHLADTTVVINTTTTVSAVWREPSVQMMDRLDAPVPVAAIRLSDYPAIARGDRVAKGGRDYRVIGVEPDGYGMADLRLELWS